MSVPAGPEGKFSGVSPAVQTPASSVSSVSKSTPTNATTAMTPVMKVFVGCLLIVLALSIAFGVTAQQRLNLANERLDALNARDAQLSASARAMAFMRPQCNRTAAALPTTVPAMVKTSHIFRPLDKSEMSAVMTYLRSQTTRFGNLAADDSLEIASNYVHSMELNIPSKAQALAHIDGSGAAPAREARVTVVVGTPAFDGLTTRQVVEYRVGPLPSPTYAVRIGQPFIPWLMRAIDDREYAGFEDVIVPAMQAGLNRILYESFGEDYDTGVEGECNSCGMTWTDTSPRGYTRGERATWIWFLGHKNEEPKETEGFYVRTTGVEMRIQHNTPDKADWRILEIVYNGVGFANVSALVYAYDNGRLAKVKLPADEDPTWSSMRRKGASRAGEELPAPISFSPAGRRFVVQGNAVSWLGWNFYIGHSLKAGIYFWDMRFKGDRIVYEMGLNEAYASYSGFAPVQAQTVYTDSGWGMGWSSYELVNGVDCPEGAVYLNMTYFYQDHKAYTIRNYACIFEERAPEGQIMRHYDQDFEGSYNFIAAYLQTRLVVRTSSSVYNYDYLYDTIFMMDGTIQNKATASGYIQASFPSQWPSGNREVHLFATKVRNGTIGNLHDHLFAYKVDLDILGTSNRVERHNVKMGRFDLPWSFPSRNHPMRYMEHVAVSTEAQGVSSYVQDFARPAMFAQYANGRDNAWGHHRAYRFQIETGAIQLFNDSATNIMPSVQWSKYNLVFVQRKENISEHSLSQYAWYDMSASADPIVRFDDWAFNGDSLVDQDIAAFVTVGVLHMPHAEDIPVTYSVGTYASFYIKPMNYNDRSPVIDVSQGIVVTKDEQISTQTYVNAGKECFPSAFDLNFYGAVSEA